MKQPILYFFLSLLFLCFLGCGDPIAKEKNLDTIRFHHLAKTEFFSIQQMYAHLLQERAGEELVNPFAYCSQVFQYESADSLFTEIDFGDGCTCQDGRIRQGKLIGRKAIKDSANIHKLLITPNQYGFIGLGGNLFQLNFLNQLSIPITSINPEDSPISNKVIKAVFNNLNGTFFWKGNLITQTSFYSEDPELQQLSYQISGTASLKDEAGHESFANTLSPLTYLAGCAYPVSGVISISANHQQGRIIDFGEGNCDQQAQVHIGVFTATLDLP